MVSYTNKYRERVNTASQPQKTDNHKATFQFKDNRSESITQKSLQNIANTSPRTNTTAQLQQMANTSIHKTGLPDNLKSGIENLSGYTMDDVRVHYNSGKPAQLQAHAYTQGSDIHVAPGQEKHLPHEAWHVVQQKQGRVKPTLQMKGTVNINDDAVLEKEADNMGRKALQMKNTSARSMIYSPYHSFPVVQKTTSIKYDTTLFDLEDSSKKEIVGKNMTANLDPTDKVNGSAPGDGVQSELMLALKDKGYKRMVRGHLLNGQLGGLGIAANLFPISTQANSKHKNHVENPIKDKVTSGKEIKYSVTVDSLNKVSNPDAKFICEAKATDDSWSLSETIVSTPGKTTVRGDNIEGGTTKGTSGFSFGSSSLPKGWGQVKKGFDGFDTHHTNTKGKSEFTFNGESKDVDNNIYYQGLNFNSGKVDLQGYAHELVAQYNNSSYHEWPIYFKENPYQEDKLEDWIDEADYDTLISIIKRMQGMVD